MFPIAPNFIHSFLPKVEISLTWAKGEAPLYFYFKECPMFHKKVMGQSKWLLAKKTIQKRLCVQAAPCN
jgi:hypothetical protein